MWRANLLLIIVVGLVCQSGLFVGETTGKVFDVTTYGVVADVKTPATAAIQKAIDACAATGGGRVRIPAGTYLSGPIQLRSNVDLHVDAGAVVFFSRNPDDYLPDSADELGDRTSPISGHDLDNVSITGPGVFDGQGDAWRPVKKGKMSDAQWTKLIQSGGSYNAKLSTWYPVSDPAVVSQRPALLLLKNCRHVLLDGPTFRNSPNWDLHPWLCTDVTIRNVTIFNPAYAQNGDGIDIDSCSNVTMSDSTVNAGDDAICLKSGSNEAGRKLGRPTENVVITRCAIGTGHGGITIGSEMSGGVRDVVVSHCSLKGTDAGIRFKTVRGRGGSVENIQISDLSMSDIHEGAIEFNMFYGMKRPGADAQPVSDATPSFKNIRISNIACESAQTALIIRGLPEMPIRDVNFDNIQINADKPGEVNHVDGISLKDVQITTESDATVAMKAVSHLVTDHVRGISESQ
jgi:polygalacturonase